MHNGPSAAGAAVGSLMRFVFPSAPGAYRPEAAAI